MSFLWSAAKGVGSYVFGSGATPAASEDGQTLTISDDNVFFRRNGAVRRYNRQTSEFEPAAVDLTGVIARTGDHTFQFLIMHGDSLVSQIDVDADWTLSYDRADSSIQWVALVGDQNTLVKFIFHNPEDLLEFQKAKTAAVFEATHHTTLQDVVASQADRDYIYQAEAGPEPMDLDDPLEDYELSGQSEDDYEDDDFAQTRGRRAPAAPAAAAATSSAPEANSYMAPGKKQNRTFVVRSSKLGYFKHDSDDQLRYIGKMDVRGMDGQSFTPQSAVLHHGETNLLLQNPETPDLLSIMDIERGQVVEEFHALKDIPVTQVCPQTKHGEMTNSDLVTALNRGSLMTLDLRVNSSNKMVESQQYKSRPGLTCVATTRDGNVATGSSNGIIRLHTKAAQRAKTQFVGLGDAITGIDTTANGEYVLVTTARYLLLVPTAIPGDAKGRTGFRAGMSKDLKPQPIKLRLHPRDIARNQLLKEDFRPATFDHGRADGENWIATAIGNFVVTWNLHQVLHGHVWNYSVREFGGKVVADQFRFDHAQEVVVTLPNSVLARRQRRRA